MSDLSSNAVDAAITSRRSIRAFLPTPVSDATVREILDVSSRAPSGTNTQPWKVHVLTGDARRRVSDAILAAYNDPTERAQHAEEYDYYPREWVSPYIDRRRKVGWDLYGLLEIGKTDKDKMHAQHGRNYAFFDAPVGLIFTIDRIMAKGSWLDYGMFLENIMVAARGRGLDTCPQAAFTQFHRVIKHELGLGDHEMVVCGMALGVADPDAVANRLTTARATVDEFAKFHLMTKPAVFIARRVFGDIVDRLRVDLDVRTHDADAPLSQPELIAALQGCAGVFITGSEKIDAVLLEACPQLKAVCTMAVGYNNIDVPACTARGVVVTNAPGVLTETTADFGFALMMAAARRISESERFLREGRWSHWGFDMFAGGDVHGATLGVLGMGRIGQAIAKRGHGGFDMRVAYHNRSHLAPDVEASLGATWMTLPDLLRSVDHLVIVTPYSAETHHLIGTAQLKLMKPTATLTNIARGGVVDDVALAAALAAGTIAAAGLDVFEGEPTVNPALLALRNVVLTPHIASASVPTRRAMASLAADNMLAALGVGPDAGRPPTALNPEALA